MTRRVKLRSHMTMKLASLSVFFSKPGAKIFMLFYLLQLMILLFLFMNMKISTIKNTNTREKQRKLSRINSTRQVGQICGFIFRQKKQIQKESRGHLAAFTRPGTLLCWSICHSLCLAFGPYIGLSVRSSCSSTANFFSFFTCILKQQARSGN